MKYTDNDKILCSSCNKPRYMGRTTKNDNELCCCLDQKNIPTYVRELTDEELLYASEEDWGFYNEIAGQLPSMAGKNNDGLDKFGTPIPYHSGPHILRHFRTTLEIVKPNTILEIGFNMGHSAAMLLELWKDIEELVSIDVSEKDETINGSNILKQIHNGRFQYFNRNSKRWNDVKEAFVKLDQPVFDLCFIDGGHEEEDVTKDIELCKELKIPFILGDDFYKRFGPGVQVSFDKFKEMELIADMNNLKLYKTNF